jgi:hypothetical protein
VEVIEERDEEPEDIEGEEEEEGMDHRPLCIPERVSLSSRGASEGVRADPPVRSAPVRRVIPWVRPTLLSFGLKKVGSLSQIGAIVKQKVIHSYAQDTS